MELSEITRDFSEYKTRKYDEETLVTICRDSIIPREPFTSSASKTETTTSVRRDKWRLRRDGPPMRRWDYLYDWDLEPDTTYALSINLFDPQIRKTLIQEKAPWLTDDFSVCPYYTIEYKCSEKTGKESEATSQIFAASMIWLYQRKQIREAASSISSKECLKHYSSIFFDEKFTIYEARLSDDSYKIRTLASGVLTRVEDVTRYIRFNNAIHAWGLGANATSFKEDITNLLKSTAAQSLPTPQSNESIPPVDLNYTSQQSWDVQNNTAGVQDVSPDERPKTIPTPQGNESTSAATLHQVPPQI